MNKDVRINCYGEIIKWSIRKDSAAKIHLQSPVEKIKEMSDYLSLGNGKNLSELIIEVPFTEWEKTLICSPRLVRN